MVPQYPIFYFRSISNAIQREMNHQVEQLGLTSGQGIFLRRIWFCQEKLHIPVYAKDLEEYFNITHPTVSGILQRLQSAGYLEFCQDAEDRRRKAIRLSRKAMELQAPLEAHIAEMNARLVQGMAPEQLDSFCRLLRLAADNMGICQPEGCAPSRRERNE